MTKLCQKFMTFLVHQTSPQTDNAGARGRTPKEVSQQCRWLPETHPASAQAAVCTFCKE